MLKNPKSYSQQKRYAANLLGSFSLAVMDKVEAAVEATTGFGGEAPAIIVTIGSEPGNSTDFVAKAVGLSHSGAVRAVAKLQKRGLVAKRAGSDARSSVLSLTAKGKRLMKQIIAAKEAALMCVLDNLAGDELKILGQDIGRLLQTLAKSDLDGFAICRLCDDAVCRSIGCPVDAAVKLL